MMFDLFLKNRQGGDLSLVERTVLDTCPVQIVRLGAGQTLVKQEMLVDSCSFLIEGVMSSHIHGAHGLTLIALSFPGVFVDIHGYALKRLDHDIRAFTPATVGIVSHECLEEVQSLCPELWHRLWLCNLADAAIQRQKAWCFANLKGIERLAHFLCETNARLMAIEHSSGRYFALPLSVAEIGDICALTPAQAMRSLRELHERRLCTLHAGQLEIHDLPALTRLGNFRPNYLYLSPQLEARLQFNIPSAWAAGTVFH